MKRYSFVHGILVATPIIAYLIFASYASAGERMAFGEIKSSRGVQINSSTGRWVQMQEIYPLLQSTGIRTNDGIALITTEEGSRLDFSRETEAGIEAKSGSYAVNLVKGTLSFSMTPSSSLTVTTKDADISVSQQMAGQYPLVAGPAAPSYAKIQGMVNSTAKGTFIRSISGRIRVSLRGAQARVLDTGESLFTASGRQGDDSVVENQPRNMWLARALVLGEITTAGTILSLEAFRREGVYSKHVP
jgi:ferric-dicitrate binding protein FerR (iron transport regulator)